jgi:hypothetical protein
VLRAVEERKWWISKKNCVNIWQQIRKVLTPAQKTNETSTITCVVLIVPKVLRAVEERKWWLWKKKLCLYLATH